jgi:hypothetical protein
MGRCAREGVCRKLGATLRDARELLWVGGHTLGTDRRDGRSPFDFGNDATVGLATTRAISERQAQT